MNLCPPISKWRFDPSLNAMVEEKPLYRVTNRIVGHVNPYFDEAYIAGENAKIGDLKDFFQGKRNKIYIFNDTCKDVYAFWKHLQKRKCKQ